MAQMLKDAGMTKDIYEPDYVAALFDRCSAAYRNWSAVSSFGFVWLWRRQCVGRIIGQQQIAKIASGQNYATRDRHYNVCDLMAGTGEVWPHVLRHYPHAQITAIDISKRMHTEAVDRLHGSRRDNITHLQANALTTELPDNSADVLVSTFGLKTFDADQQTILARQIARLLRDGGSFCAIEASDPKDWIGRGLYRFYLDRVLPLVERVFLKGAQDFSMIGTYTKNFENCRHFEQALRDQGLKVSYKKHFFGCVTSVAGYKPIAQSSPKA